MEPNEVQKEADTAGRKAVLFGVGAMVLAAVFGWMLAKLSGGGPEKVPVVVAAEEIGPLTDLKAKQLRVVDWPTVSVPVGAFHTVEEVLARKQLSLAGMVVGEPVLAARLSSPERGLGVSQLVESGMRAFTIQVNEWSATAQIVHPQAFVDVIATLEDPRTRDVLSKVILQNVQVLAVGDSVEVEAAPVAPGGPGAVSDAHNQNERHRVVTLMVNPAEIEFLAFAGTHGKLDLALRSNVDSELVTTPGVNIERMLGSRGAAAGQAAAQPANTAPDARLGTVPAARPRGRGRGATGAFTIRH